MPDNMKQSLYDINKNIQKQKEDKENEVKAAL